MAQVLASIYQERGPTAERARQIAEPLIAHDALALMRATNWAFPRFPRSDRQRAIASRAEKATMTRFLPWLSAEHDAIERPYIRPRDFQWKYAEFLAPR